MTASSRLRSIVVADIGGTHVKCGLVQDGAPQEAQQLFPTSALRNADPLGALASLMQSFCRDAACRPDLALATVPGFIARDGDHVMAAKNIPELEGIAFRSGLTERLGVPVRLERDSILALAGEAAAGAARDTPMPLGIFFGTGVGAALLNDGRPFRGSGWALEIGHIPFRGEGRGRAGLRTDTLETYVSGHVLEEIARRHDRPVSGLFAHADETRGLRDELDRFVLDQAMAVGIAVALLSPSAIILGGGICEMRGFPRDRLAALIAAHAPFAETGQAMDLRWATLGWRAVLHGAAALPESPVV